MSYQTNRFLLTRQRNCGTKDEGKFMLQFNPIHLAFAVMIIGIVFTFVLSKQEIKRLRTLADAFAIPFVKLSNYIAPQKPISSLLIEKIETGSIKPLSAEEQSKEMQSIFKRAGNNKAVKLFREMVEAENELKKAAGKNRRKCYQFADPVARILYMTHTFLTGCENLTLIDTENKLEEFNSFLNEQVQHRMTLLRLINGSLADEYRELNKVYAAEMEQIEREQTSSMTRNQQ